MQAFVDLEGKIPAKPGDRVALVIQTEPMYARLEQPLVAHRPTLGPDGGIVFEATADRDGIVDSECMTQVQPSVGSSAA